MCTTGHHDLKADLEKLRTETTDGGAQTDRDGTVLFVYRTCGMCRSSICIEPEVAARL